MTSHALSVSRNRLDIWLRDSREWGRLHPDQFRMGTWFNERLANFASQPHTDHVSIYFSDSEGWKSWSLSERNGQDLDGGVTVVGGTVTLRSLFAISAFPAQNPNDTPIPRN